MPITAVDAQPGMGVIGSDDNDLGRLDHMNGAHAVKLAQQDSTADGKHHWIPNTSVESVSDGKLKLNISSSDAIEQRQAEAQS